VALVAEPGRTSVLLAVEQLRRAVPGGIGAYARGLLTGLDQAGAERDGIAVTLLASRAPGILPARRRDAVDPLVRWGKPVRLSRLPGPLMTRAWDHGLVRAPDGFDVLHSVTTAAPAAGRSGRTHRVVTVHDLAWRRHPEATTRRGRGWHERSLLRAIDSGAAIVVPSRLVAADLVAAGVERGRLTVAGGGTDHLAEPDHEAVQVLLRHVGITDEFLLTVSTLEPRKNLDRLVEAYSSVRSSLPGPWPLVVVGPTGWGGKRSQPHEEGVVFTGSVSDAALAGLYASARAFAYVPLTEGYGLPPLEAMRAGTPTVVGREVPSVHDLDDAAPAPARLVDPFDVDDIAAGLVDVLTRDELRRDLTGRGATYAQARTWRATAQAHIELWQSLR
jgi:glycosyltransferase involved in cell wall biosynthesis